MSVTDATYLHVEIVYALPDRQTLLAVAVAPGTTVEAAIQASGLLALFNDIDLAQNKVGIFGKLVTLATVLRDKDRIEIYRPLIADAKQARRQRVANDKAKK